MLSDPASTHGRETDEPIAGSPIESCAARDDRRPAALVPGWGVSHLHVQPDAADHGDARALGSRLLPSRVLRHWRGHAWDDRGGAARLFSIRHPLRSRCALCNHCPRHVAVRMVGAAEPRRATEFGAAGNLPRDIDLRHLLGLAIAILMPPYVLLGIAVSLALRRSSLKVNLVYGVDLLGAAAGMAFSRQAAQHPRASSRLLWGYRPI